MEQVKHRIRIGEEFYIYYPHKGLEHGRGYGYDHDDLYRRRVIID